MTARDAASGIATAVRLAFARPALLGRVRLVAVDGPSGSGKSTLAEPLAAAFAREIGGAAVTVVSTDLLATWEHPLEWWPVLEEHLLAPLQAGRVANLPVTEWISGRPRPGGSLRVPPVDVLVLEGVSSGRQQVTGRLSALVWVEIADRSERLERAVARDGEAMRPFLARWQVQEDEHFNADGTRRRADVVIDPS